MVQADVHAAYGGVVPNLAMEAHKAAMDSCVEDALQQAGITAQDLSAVAVSIGPGLSPCLQVCPCIYLAGFAPGSNCGGGVVHASHKCASTMTH
jgi:tRNA A37 threonylcarbamoyltransferase TsaD